ncbi:MAG: immunoglobulin domain-containing protein, partial [Candidatus Kapabacteria bacterium]|nr:immunoglobulin domain-containing protein [Candidatus Kapabacteria bacterium]
GNYRVQVVGTCSATPVTSAVASVVVQQAFTVISQPTWPSSPTNVGQTVTLTVGYTGTAAFQWQRDQQRNNNWVNVGTNSNVYSYTVNTIADSGNFRCIVTGPCNTGSFTTNTAAVFTCQPPSITQQPSQPAPLCPGNTLSLSVQVNSQGQTVTYQWQQDANRNGTWVNITGATNATYTKTNIQASDDGKYRVQVLSTCSSTPVNSDVIDVIVRAPITVTNHPASQTVCVNANVTFSVTVVGNNPSYQWFFNGAPISAGVNPTAVTSTLQLTNVSASNAGTYSCFISGACSPNGVTSNNATLTVNSTVVITEQPQGITGCTGTPITFTVVAVGTSLGYQWRFNSTNIAGATNATYTITNPTTANNGSYNVLVTSSCGNTTSNAATVALTIPAAFTTQPVAQTICQGSSTSMSVAINSDAANPTFQWRLNGANISQLDNQTANLPTLVITNAQTSQTGTYTCLVKTTCQPNGTSSNGAILTINPATTITTQPNGVTVCEGTPATLSVVAIGTSLTYQWRKNGTDVFGATNASYNIPSVVTGDAGTYTVVVGGSCAPLSVTSNSAVLAVNQRAQITGTPLTNQTVCQGVNIQFATNAIGAEITYQWRKNTVAITGNASAQTATLTLSNVSPSDNGTYDCLVIGTCSPNGVFTNSAVLTVNVPVSMQTTPQSQTVCEGANVQFVSAATGSVLGYQWRYNGQAITSNATATSPILVLNGVTLQNAGVYDVVVNGLCNLVTTAPATLTINQPMSITSQPTSQQGCAGSAISTSVVVSGSVLGYQ